MEGLEINWYVWGNFRYGKGFCYKLVGIDGWLVDDVGKIGLR